MTTYRLTFLRDAKKEWDKLDSKIRNQFSKKLAERLSNPRIPSAKLAGMPNCYKIKLHSAGYRLVYRVDDGRIVVQVIAVGKRERSAIYEAANKRI
ncbi:type II toxin-antitoxin system RelE family toxin [Sandaracinobacteroides saxicola]|uniref:Type II toxin-antitoxin system RelE/ParE family toxin n=1 Tax=Sandaracinobacteroides saxicola TaxID=2759707 RepID=A0A7G5IEM2_9SPHN|nr:type II toxin-antitoxin system RelE/ParE family toxin [Sandaracinobacteroides saxicola]QMW21814.1 type II toxin-antitoxin system RelE/ParE family toxin [Sandaracinobacteroides saxicola]